MEIKTFNLAVEDSAKLRQLAEKQGCSASAYLRLLIRKAKI